MKRSMDTEIKVGIFVCIGISLLMVAVLVLSGESLFSKKNTYYAHFPSIEGLIPGSKVSLGGIGVGVVDSIDLDSKRRDIQVQFSVLQKTSEWIRGDSTVEIATQGMLGDKFLNINAGTEAEPVLKNKAEIPYRPVKDLNQFLSKSDQLLVTLNSVGANLDLMLKRFNADNRSETFFKGISATAKNMQLATEKLNRELDQIKIKDTVGELNQILEKVNNGTGTLGALVNDPSLYDQMQALMGGASRNRLIRNLVRHTIENSEDKSDDKSESKSKPSKKR